MELLGNSQGGGIVAQRVGMRAFADRSPLGGFTTGMPNRFCVNRLITAMIFSAWEEPNSRLFPQPPPVFPEFLEQFLAQHHVPIFAFLPALDVNHHALAIDVGNFQVRQFGTTHSGGIERHQ